MKLSILDQAPISANQTAKEALEQSVLLAQAGERMGYTRYWIAEHHDMTGLACPAPEVMLPYIGAMTNKIRIGSGAVLLPHYKPYKVAEIYNMLSTLFPGRIDIGIGRAPGGSAEVTSALSDNFLQNVWKMPESLRDLLHFINNDHEEDSDFAKISASPLPEVRPEQWLLGTSKKSALLAAEYGMAYAFGLFMSEKDAAEILESYYESFKPGSNNVPQSILTVSAICADTTEQAEEIALSSLIWNIQRGNSEGQSGLPSIEDAKLYKLSHTEHEAVETMKKKMIIGDSRQVKHKLLELQKQYNTDEIMIVTNTYLAKDRIRSYELIAEGLL
ncbi:LLM class flavin-dependent oxidoreductase [Mesobacillus subterraneus]|uniref:LLM class flavin-dependent oxidoreductase n=1 Tax=Mesobacillus subterraneus TaxID=285983 RepID=UPI00203C43E0|nr:LLM class flavin-dependent oxidoreductase [Mesobacillus subterraneus]MCM3664153.1 LLM class flavin-dependent oxidoreductase [Mesobacillus subterraneus]MCM3682181.1 LLM class flavin-dependent oxidoreductase [Mesobacillus subterraneus]